MAGEAAITRDVGDVLGPRTATLLNGLEWDVDGSRLEGVGNSPDVEIHPTAQDLKQGRDVVLNKALELASSP